MGHRNEIVLPEDAIPVQSSLITPGAGGCYDPYPEILRDDAGVERILNSCNGALGLDFEFDPARGNRPSIIGVASKYLAAAVPWKELLAARIVEDARRGKYKLVGHAVISADRLVLRDAGFPTDRTVWEDTLLKHYLLNQDLCKAPGKDESDDSGALGFMDLYTMAVLTTMLPNWKSCRGVDCYGPCPTHQVFLYNAVDAWSGREGNEVMDGRLSHMRVPRQLYEELAELSEVTVIMRERGVKVDREYVKGLEKNFDAEKEKLFPGYTTKTARKSDNKESLQGNLFDSGGTFISQVQGEFNPKSPKQIEAYFHELGLKTSQGKDVQKLLEKCLRREGFPTLKDFEDSPEILTGPVEVLYRLHQYKSSGKGLSSWFDKKYLGKDGLMHPRFIVTGTSTGRLSSSGPNFQNIPKNGFGKNVRRALIPRGELLELLTADFRQLELRMCLYLAGIDPAVIGEDAFTWLVSESGGLFTKAADIAKVKERQIAKRVSHAADYLEGFTIVMPSELGSGRTRAEIEAGALRVYDDWEYGGGLVAFTGANLAESLFGNKDWDNRKKALEIQEDIYFAKFPGIRAWHRRVLAEVESRGYITSPTGRFLRLSGMLYGGELRAEAMIEDAKIAAAFLGQGVSADHVQAIMLLFYREDGAIPLLQVHDDLTFEIPSSWSNDKAREFIGRMTGETWRLPGFKSPVEIKRGRNWMDADENNPGGLRVI